MTLRELVVLALRALALVMLVGCPSSTSTGDVQASSKTAQEKADRIRGCPHQNWPGPWTACSEADWVRRVVESAGYRITDETGSALVAKGKGKAFYIWTTELTRPMRELVAEEDWTRLSTMEGVEVYGDERLWRFWSAQGFVFCVKQGPTDRSVLPDGEELATLIRESLRLRPPRR
jgi:hypothetical protein